MTIDAGHSGLGVARPVPRLGFRILLVALDTQVRTHFLAEDTVRIMTGRALKLMGAIDFVGMSR